MSVIGTYKNNISFDPLCEISVLRFSAFPSAITVDSLCSICLIPYEGCNTVDKERSFTLKIGSVMQYVNLEAADETWLSDRIVNQTLEWENITGCHWTSSIDKSRGGSTTLKIAFNLTVTDDTPGIVNYSLAVAVHADTELSGWSDNVPLTITYTLADVDPWHAAEKTLTTAAVLAARTVGFNPSDNEQMIFPEQLSLSVA